MSTSSIAIISIALQALTIHATNALAQESMPTVPAPEFAAVSLTDDQRKSLSDYRGEVVLLNFWASWCFPCRYEMPAFQRMYDKYRDRGFTVVAVSVFDDKSNARAFQRRYGFSFPMLFDTTGQVKQAYDVQVVPQTFLIDRGGRLVPIVDPTTRRTSLSVNDPTLWEDPDMISFIESLIEESGPPRRTDASRLLERAPGGARNRL